MTLRSKPDGPPAHGVFAVIAVVGAEPSVLLLRSSEPGSRWQLPGGEAHPGEDNEAALRRELNEELGIEVSIGPVKVIREERQQGPAVTLTYWPIQAQDEFLPRLSVEHDAFEWVPLRQASHRSFDSSLNPRQLAIIFDSLAAMTETELAGRVTLVP